MSLPWPDLEEPDRNNRWHGGPPPPGSSAETRSSRKLAKLAGNAVYTTYILKRVLHSLIVILCVSVVVFLLSHISGDPAAVLLPPDASDEQIQHFKELMGLDQPIHIQYYRFIGKAIRGDLGTSLMFRRPAMELVLERLPASLKLTLAALGLAVIFGVPLGAIAALNRGKLADLIASTASMICLCFPSFFLGIVLILVFCVRFRLFPAAGGTDLRNMVLPAVVLSAYTVAMLTRLLRSSLIEVLSQPYISTARSKGLREWVVVFKHAGRNAAIPVVTLLGLRLGEILGQAVVTETVFNYPGLSRLAIQGIENGDYILVQSFILVTALAVTGGNLLADLAYVVLDPRIKYD